MPLERDNSALDAELAALRVEVARLREERKRDEQLIRELGDAVTARDAFLAVAAHELRNPMSGIMLAATNLGHLARHSTDPAHTWLPSRVALLERQARRFVRRATMLLDISRLTSGQLRLDPEIVDLAHTVRETADELAVEAERSKSVLHIDAPEPVVGFWDHLAIEQIAWNSSRTTLSTFSGSLRSRARSTRSATASSRASNGGRLGVCSSTASTRSSTARRTRERVPQFFAALAERLRTRGVTTVYAAELHDIFSSRIASPSEGLSPLLESLIVMRFSEMHARVRRVISVLKLRDSDFDSTLSEFEITHRGLRMKATLANAEDVLTGTAHDRASTITTKVTATKTRDERTAKRRSKKR